MRFQSFFKAKSIGSWGSAPDPDGGAYLAELELDDDNKVKFL